MHTAIAAQLQSSRFFLQPYRAFRYGFWRGSAFYFEYFNSDRSKEPPPTTV
jgi:hypothetical protein